MGDWYNSYKVVPADNRAVLVMYSVRTEYGYPTEKMFVGVGRYDEDGYELADGSKVSWLVERVAEDGKTWQKSPVKIDGCDKDGNGLQVWEWKEIVD